MIRWNVDILAPSYIHTRWLHRNVWEVKWFDGATRIDWLQEELLKVNGEDRDGQRENGSSGTNEVE